MALVSPSFKVKLLFAESGTPCRYLYFLSRPGTAQVTPCLPSPWGSYDPGYAVSPEPATILFLLTQCFKCRQATEHELSVHPPLRAYSTGLLQLVFAYLHVAAVCVNKCAA